MWSKVGHRERELDEAGVQLRKTLALDEMEAGDVYPKVEVGGRISLAPHDRIPAAYKCDELVVRIVSKKIKNFMFFSSFSIP